ncbi:MAG: 30S ribosome-binding factor RbfA [Planctomycetia bacterium]
MAEPRRLLRLQQLVLETLATALQRDVDDPRVAGVSITRVKLSKDLSRALVFWSSLESGGPRRTAERGLEDARPFLQALVASAMSTRLTPHLAFKFDEGLERAGRIEALFDRLATERGEAPAGESPAGDAPADETGGAAPGAPAAGDEEGGQASEPPASPPPEAGPSRRGGPRRPRR